MQPTLEPPPALPGADAGGRCANCGAELVGEYCAICGQRDEPIQQPASHFIREAVVEYLELDGRLWRTLAALFVRPGHLTLEYNAGRRRRYLRPFRLYLTATVLFFFALALVDPAQQVDVNSGEARRDTLVRAEERIESVEVAVEGLAATRAAFESGEIEAWGAPLGQIDGEIRRLESEREALMQLPPDSLVRPGALAADSTSVDGAGVLSALPDWLKGSSIRRLEAADSAEELREAKRAFARGVIGRVPTAMLFLLPLFAAMLKLLYLSGGGLRRPGRRTRRRFRAARRRQRRPWRRAARAAWAQAPLALRIRRRASLRRQLTAKRTRYLSEHLVFALHVHAFAFFVFLVILLLGRAGDGPAITRLSILLAWGVPLYFVLAQKRVYAQRWIKTFVKALALGIVYGIALFFGGFVALALAATLG